MPGKVFTYLLTADSFTVNRDYGLKAVSMKLVSGTGSFTGTGKVGDLSSAAIPLAVDDPVTISDYEPLDGVTITADGGSTIYIIGIPA